ncbi:Rib/alpha-like domain-containing protein [Streptococcus sp. 1449]|uniref:Rib/alpha-like domain-containing protein n=1 Tax=Streptococcus sp. 1449 TaxID=2582658 RepID=UPI0015668653|nr:Rib/alpha-like domain-containing protein [Streptococcus sp. 1449]
MDFGKYNKEKVFRYSIRKYHFGAASVAVAALMFFANGAVAAHEPITPATANEVATVGSDGKADGDLGSSDEGDSNKVLTDQPAELKAPDEVKTQEAPAEGTNQGQAVAESNSAQSETNPASQEPSQAGEVREQEEPTVADTTAAKSTQSNLQALLANLTLSSMQELHAEVEARLAAAKAVLEDPKATQAQVDEQARLMAELMSRVNQALTPSLETPTILEKAGLTSTGLASTGLATPEGATTAQPSGGKGRRRALSEPTSDENQVTPSAGGDSTGSGAGSQTTPQTLPTYTNTEGKNGVYDLKDELEFITNQLRANNASEDKIQAAKAAVDKFNEAFSKGDTISQEDFNAALADLKKSRELIEGVLAENEANAGVVTGPATPSENNVTIQPRTNATGWSGFRSIPAGAPTRTRRAAGQDRAAHIETATYNSKTGYFFENGQNGSPYSKYTYVFYSKGGVGTPYYEGGQISEAYKNFHIDVRRTDTGLRWKIVVNGEHKTLGVNKFYFTLPQGQTLRSGTVAVQTFNKNGGSLIERPSVAPGENELKDALANAFANLPQNSPFRGARLQDVQKGTKDNTNARISVVGTTAAQQFDVGTLEGIARQATHGAAHLTDRGFYYRDRVIETDPNIQKYSNEKFSRIMADVKDVYTFQLDREDDRSYEITFETNGSRDLRSLTFASGLKRVEGSTRQLINQWYARTNDEVDLIEKYPAETQGDGVFFISQGKRGVTNFGDGNGGEVVSGVFSVKADKPFDTDTLITVGDTNYPYFKTIDYTSYLINSGNKVEANQANGAPATYKIYKLGTELVGYSGARQIMDTPGATNYVLERKFDGPTGDGSSELIGLTFVVKPKTPSLSTELTDSVGKRVTVEATNGTKGVEMVLYRKLANGELEEVKRAAADSSGRARFKDVEVGIGTYLVKTVAKGESYTQNGNTTNLVFSDPSNEKTAVARPFETKPIIEKNVDDSITTTIGQKGATKAEVRYTDAAGRQQVVAFTRGQDSYWNKDNSNANSTVTVVDNRDGTATVHMTAGTAALNTHVFAKQRSKTTDFSAEADFKNTDLKVGLTLNGRDFKNDKLIKWPLDQQVGGSGIKFLAKSADKIKDIRISGADGLGVTWVKEGTGTTSMTIAARGNFNKNISGLHTLSVTATTVTGNELTTTATLVLPPLAGNFKTTNDDLKGKSEKTGNERPIIEGQGFTYPANTTTQVGDDRLQWKVFLVKGGSNNENEFTRPAQNYQIVASSLLREDGKVTFRPENYKQEALGTDDVRMVMALVRENTDEVYRGVQSSLSTQSIHATTPIVPFATKPELVTTSTGDVTATIGRNDANAAIISYVTENGATQNTILNKNNQNWSLAQPDSNVRITNGTDGTATVTIPFGVARSRTQVIAQQKSNTTGLSEASTTTVPSDMEAPTVKLTNKGSNEEVTLTDDASVTTVDVYRGATLELPLKYYDNVSTGKVNISYKAGLPKGVSFNSNENVTTSTTIKESGKTETTPGTYTVRGRVASDANLGVQTVTLKVSDATNGDVDQGNKKEVKFNIRVLDVAFEQGYSSSGNDKKIVTEATLNKNTADPNTYLTGTEGTRRSDYILPQGMTFRYITGTNGTEFKTNLQFTTPGKYNVKAAAFFPTNTVSTKGLPITPTNATGDKISEITGRTYIARDIEFQVRPTAPEVSAETNGDVIVSPTNQANVNRLSFSYTDKNNVQKNLTATKTGNVWVLSDGTPSDGVTIDSATGKVTIKDRQVKDNASVTAKLVTVDDIDSTTTSATSNVGERVLPTITFNEKYTEVVNGERVAYITPTEDLDNGSITLATVNDNSGKLREVRLSEQNNLGFALGSGLTYNDLVKTDNQEVTAPRDITVTGKLTQKNGNRPWRNGDALYTRYIVATDASDNFVRELSASITNPTRVALKVLTQAVKYEPIVATQALAKDITAAGQTVSQDEFTAIKSKIQFTTTKGDVKVSHDTTDLEIVMKENGAIKRDADGTYYVGAIITYPDLSTEDIKVAVEKSDKEAPTVKMNGVALTENADDNRFVIYRGARFNPTFEVNDNSGKTTYLKASGIPNGVWFNKQGGTDAPKTGDMNNGTTYTLSTNNTVEQNAPLGEREANVVVKDALNNERTYKFKYVIADLEVKNSPKTATLNSELGNASEFIGAVGETNSTPSDTYLPDGTTYKWTKNTSEVPNTTRLTSAGRNTDYKVVTTFPTGGPTKKEIDGKNVTIYTPERVEKNVVFNVTEETPPTVKLTNKSDGNRVSILSANESSSPVVTVFRGAKLELPLTLFDNEIAGRVNVQYMNGLPSGVSFGGTGTNNDSLTLTGKTEQTPAEHIIKGTVATDAQLGTTIVTLKVSDGTNGISSGNQAEVKFRVKVVDLDFETGRSEQPNVDSITVPVTKGENIPDPNHFLTVNDGNNRQDTGNFPQNMTFRYVDEATGTTTRTLRYTDPGRYVVKARAYFPQNYAGVEGIGTVVSGQTGDNTEINGRRYIEKTITFELKPTAPVVTPKDNGDVVITNSNETNANDLSITYTNTATSTGAPVTVTAQKTNGRWTLINAPADGVIIDETTGTVTIKDRAVKDSATVTAKVTAKGLDSTTTSENAKIGDKIPPTFEFDSVYTAVESNGDRVVYVTPTEDITANPIRLGTFNDDSGKLRTVLLYADAIGAHLSYGLEYNRQDLQNNLEITAPKEVFITGKVDARNGSALWTNGQTLITRFVSTMDASGNELKQIQPNNASNPTRVVFKILTQAVKYTPSVSTVTIERDITQPNTSLTTAEFNKVKDTLTFATDRGTVNVRNNTTNLTFEMTNANVQTKPDGTWFVTARVTYPDGSNDIVEVPLNTTDANKSKPAITTASVKAEKDASVQGRIATSQNDRVLGKITIPAGQPTPTSKAIKNNGAITEDNGKKVVTVELTYSDNSKKEVKVPILEVKPVDITSTFNEGDNTVTIKPETPVSTGDKLHLSIRGVGMQLTKTDNGYTNSRNDRTISISGDGSITVTLAGSEKFRAGDRVVVRHESNLNGQVDSYETEAWSGLASIDQVPVVNPNSLTSTEIEAVKAAVKKANPSVNLAELQVATNGDVTYRHAGAGVNTGDTIPIARLNGNVREQNQSEKYKPEVTALIRNVKNAVHTADEIKAAVKEVHIKAKDVVGDVPDNGGVVVVKVTYTDGSSKDVNVPIVVTPEKTPVKNTTDLTSTEKESVRASVQKLNPTATNIVVEENGRTLVTLPDVAMVTVEGNQTVKLESPTITATSGDKLRDTDRTISGTAVNGATKVTLHFQDNTEVTITPTNGTWSYDLPEGTYLHQTEQNNKVGYSTNKVTVTQTAFGQTSDAREYSVVENRTFTGKSIKQIAGNDAFSELKNHPERLLNYQENGQAATLPNYLTATWKETPDFTTVGTRTATLLISEKTETNNQTRPLTEVSVPVTVYPTVVAKKDKFTTLLNQALPEGEQPERYVQFKNQSNANVNKPTDGVTVVWDNKPSTNVTTNESGENTKGSVKVTYRVTNADGTEESVEQTIDINLKVYHAVPLTKHVTTTFGTDFGGTSNNAQTYFLSNSPRTSSAWKSTSGNGYSEYASYSRTSEKQKANYLGKYKDGIQVFMAGDNGQINWYRSEKFDVTFEVKPLTPTVEGATTGATSLTVNNVNSGTTVELYDATDTTKAPVKIGETVVDKEGNYDTKNNISVPLTQGLAPGTKIIAKVVYISGSDRTESDSSSEVVIKHPKPAELTSKAKMNGDYEFSVPTDADKVTFNIPTENDGTKTVTLTSENSWASTDTAVKKVGDKLVVPNGTLGTTNRMVQIIATKGTGEAESSARDYTVTVPKHEVETTKISKVVGGSTPTNEELLDAVTVDTKASATLKDGTTYPTALGTHTIEVVVTYADSTTEIVEVPYEVKSADKSALEASKTALSGDINQETSTAGKTEASKKAFETAKTQAQEALKKAEEVIADGNATEAEVAEAKKKADEAKTALDTARTGLTNVDKSALEASKTALSGDTNNSANTNNGGTTTPADSNSNSVTPGNSGNTPVPGVTTDDSSNTNPATPSSTVGQVQASTPAQETPVSTNTSNNSGNTATPSEIRPVDKSELARLVEELETRLKDLDGIDQSVIDATKVILGEGQEALRNADLTEAGLKEMTAKVKEALESLRGKQATKDEEETKETRKEQDHLPYGTMIGSLLALLGLLLFLIARRKKESELKKLTKELTKVLQESDLTNVDAKVLDQARETLAQAVAFLANEKEFDHTEDELIEKLKAILAQLR